jgi:CheY-like chemotaxis protein
MKGQRGDVWFDNIRKDDNFSIRTLLQYLEEEVEVVYALDGISAIAQLRVTAYSCVILDLNLPLFSGFDVAKIIRSNEKENNEIDKPIIVISSDSAPGTINLALNAELNNFLLTALTFPTVGLRS